MGGKINLLDLEIEEIQELVAKMGQDKFRARQIFQWLGKGIKDIDEMTNLSKDFRQQLKTASYIGSMNIRRKLTSKIDDTVKYLFELDDKNIIESVLMEYKHGLTACVSSQIGCRMGCKFCASAGIGFIRNLSPGEILDQVISMQKDAGKRVGNIVLMGIGEPFDNYESVVKFLKLVNMADGLNVGYRHISVSTCGLVPEILKFSNEGMPITLSISLHASNDDVRQQIMPINKKYPIDKIIEACKIYTGVTKRRITFEYALIAGTNDSKGNALELAKKIKGMLCHVNLIPVNTITGTDFTKSDRAQMELFRETLERYGVGTTVRRELGSDIEAACGQLRRSTIGNPV